MARPTSNVQALARLGAAIRLQELRTEAREIEAWLKAHGVSPAQKQRMRRRADPRQPADKYAHMKTPEFRATMRKAAKRGWQTRRARRAVVMASGNAGVDYDS